MSENTNPEENNGLEAVEPPAPEDNGIETVEVEIEVEYPIVTDPKPVMARKNGEPIEIGHATVVIHEGLTEIHVVLDTHGGQELAAFLGSKVCSSISVSGSLDPEVALKIAAQNS